MMLSSAPKTAPVIFPIVASAAVVALLALLALFTWWIYDRSGTTGPDYPTGWATLIGPLIGGVLGGVIGGSAIAYQSGQNAKQMRESLALQAQIAQEVKQREKVDEKTALAHAFMGELFSLSESLRNASTGHAKTAEMYSSARPTSRFDNTSYTSWRYPHEIYQANAARLGIFGPVIASDISMLYTSILSLENLNIKVSSSQEAAQLYISMYKRINELFNETVHLHRQLYDYNSGKQQQYESLFAFRNRQPETSNG